MYKGYSWLFFKVVTFLFIAYMMGRGAATLDTENYYLKYVEVKYSSLSNTYEPGYYLLQKLGYNLGFDFSEFKISITFISLLFMDVLVRKTTKNKVYFFYLMYLFFYIFIDTVQTRSFLSFSIVACGISFLFYSGIKYKKIIYIGFIFLAASIHISAIAYLPFLLIDFKNEKLLIRAVVLITTFSCLLILMSGTDLGAFKVLIQYVTDNSNRVEHYGNNKVKLGFLYPIVMHFISLFFIYLCMSELYKYNDKEERHTSSEFLVYTANLMYKINMIAFLFFPLYMFNMQFIRLGRGVFLLNLIFFSLIIINSRVKEFRFLYSFCGALLLLCALFYYTFILGGHIEDIIIPFFDNHTITEKYEGTS
jgi:hypothetical protein